MIQSSLLMLWMDKNTRQQSNKKSLTKENLQLLFDSTTKQARTVPTWGIEAGALNRWSMLVKLMYFTLVFNFMSPKWTRTKLVIEISPSLQAY